MVGRKVRCSWLSMTGEVVEWTPLVHGMCDALVREETGEPKYGHYAGRLCWYGSADLQPTDGLGPLPRRDVMREWARLIAIESLEGALSQHIKDFHKPWTGAEHGKAIVGNSIAGALRQLLKE